MLDTFWIILCASLVSVSCSLLGCYLILRKTAMISDAISHSVLPGIAFSFLILGNIDNIASLIGAAAFGLLATYLIEFLTQKSRVQSDASIGIIFTFLFSIGIVMITMYASNVDIDEECVLFGEIAYTPFNVWFTESGLNMGPRVIWTLGIITAVVLGFVIFFYKELQITTFDPAFAQTMGFSTSFWYYALMTTVSFTTVASFESVGAILVVALLIVPPATAYLLTENLKKMLVLSCAIGIFCSISGYYFAVFLNSSISASVVTVGGILFFCVFIYQRFQATFRQMASA